MAGQMIVLPGVTAAAGASAPRVNMNHPDTIAAKIATLKHSISARSLVAASGGGVTGRCRVTGAPLISKGSGAPSLVITEVSGRLGLGVTGPVSAGLALPANSLTSSYTMVTAINLSATDFASTGVFNFLSGFDAADNYFSVLQRAYGSANTTTNKGKLCTSPQSGGNFAAATLPAAGWAIAIVDYDIATRLASVALNQAADFNTLLMPSGFSPGAGAYVEIGYHLGGIGLGNSKVGDLYTFSDSLLKTDLGKSQLTELVAAMKTYYGIA